MFLSRDWKQQAGETEKDPVLLLVANKLAYSFPAERQSLKVVQRAWAWKGK